MTSEEIKFGFPASGISAAAGRHKYRDKYDALAEILHKYNSNVLPKTKKTRHLPSEYVHKVIVATNIQLPVVSVRTDGDRKIEKETRERLTKNVEERLSKLTISQRAAAETVAYCGRVLDINRGTYLENETLKKMNKLGYDVEKSDALLKKRFGYNDRHTIFGRVDGVIRKGSDVKSVVEIKNRKHRFFLPDYDLDQLASYVFMTGAEEGILVQQLDGELNVSTYPRDELLERWEMIVADLKRTITFARKIVKDPTGKEWEKIKEMYVFSDKKFI